jgi:phasin
LNSNFEIPDTMRDFAEKSVEHARKAFDDFLGAAHKAVDTFESSAQQAQQNARTMGEEAISFAEENMTASFEFAQRLVRAKNVDELMKIQQDFVERQMAVLGEHAGKIGAAGAAAAAGAKPARPKRGNGEV